MESARLRGCEERDGCLPDGGPPRYAGASERMRCAPA